MTLRCDYSALKSVRISKQQHIDMTKNQAV